MDFQEKALSYSFSLQLQALQQRSFLCLSSIIYTNSRAEPVDEKFEDSWSQWDKNKKISYESFSDTSKVEWGKSNKK